MSSLNEVNLIGRLGQDPELRYTGNGTAVCNMSVATDEGYKDADGNWQERTEWHKVVAWGRLAEICGEYLSKGRQAYFKGSLQTRKWEDRDGNDRYTTEVKAFKMILLGGGNKQQQSSTQKTAPKPASSSEEFFKADDDLPF